MAGEMTLNDGPQVACPNRKTLMDDWSHYAKCRGLSPSLFYPEERFKPNTAEYLAELEEIRSLCATCPVQKECLAAALSNDGDVENGIWAGTTPAQRKLLVQERDVV